MIELKKKNISLYIITLVLLMLDQIIKYIVDKSLDLMQSIKVVENFFSITYVRNDGAAWSILSGNRIFLIMITIVAMILIYVFFIKNKKLSRLENVTYGILYSGIIGNLLDRIFIGSVIDYLDFNIFGYNFPVFNLADMCIVISVILLVILIFRGEKDANKNK